MQEYTGLDFARVQPHDRLSEDLYIPAVCWFDWNFTFTEDFYQQFQVDLSDRFDPQNFGTVEELVFF